MALSHSRKPLPTALERSYNAQQRVENSEVTKRRVELEQGLANLQRWAEGARIRGRRASRLYAPSL